MRSIAKFLFLAPFIVLCMCSEEESSTTGIVRIEFNLLSDDPEKGVDTDPAEGYSILVSLKNGNQQVFKQEKISLVKIGDRYSTAPLKLIQGQYYISDLFVVNQNNKVIYATPGYGSPLASTVSTPLLYAFTVSRNQRLSLAMEVVPTLRYKPEDFGYSTFSLRMPEEDIFHLSVFARDSGASILTSATAMIQRNNDTLEIYSIVPDVNKLIFEENPDEPLTLVVTKHGYDRYTRDLTFNKLREELNGKSLAITLEPAITMMPYITESFPETTFQVNLAFTGQIEVDWGDGTSNNYTAPQPGENVTVAHQYAAPGTYFASITGDIHTLTSFYSYYGYGMLTGEINLQHASGLETLSIGLTRSPSIIDLTYNPNLAWVDVINAVDLEQLLLRPDNVITFLAVMGPNNMTTSSIDAVIDAMYQSVITQNRTEGDFELAESWLESDGNMVGPPSVQSMGKLQTLRDSYQWRIHPEF